jgi:hypothetical protein
MLQLLQVVSPHDAEESPNPMYDNTRGPTVKLIAPPKTYEPQ